MNEVILIMTDHSSLAFIICSFVIALGFIPSIAAQNNTVNDEK